MNSTGQAPENAQNCAKITVLGTSAVSEFLIVGCHHGWLGPDDRDSIEP